jgi:D-alanine-D-alanine ligase
MSVKQKKIVVLMGGPGSERAVSLKTGEAVAGALRAAGADVEEIEVRGEEVELPEDCDLVFIAIHGTFGEDGTLQRILDERGVAYTGAGADSSSLAFDKLLSKNRFVESGVPTPRYVEVPVDHLPEAEIEFDFIEVDGTVRERAAVRFPALEGQPVFDLPVVVKPPREGSSVGVHIVETSREIEKAFVDVAQYGDRVLVEECVRGRELTVGVLGEDALPVVEIRPESGFYDINNKYPWLESKGKTSYFCPAELPEEVTATVQAVALAAHVALGVEVYSRVDVLLDDRNEPWVLEVNTIPGMTESSLLPKAAAAAGTDFCGLCSRIAELSLQARSSETPG